MTTALLTLQTGDRASAPIFCVPGAGDNIMAFASLCDALGSRYSLYGFQAQGLIDEQAPHATVEAAASCYVQELLQEPPSKPYHLVGHSFGGWIIFEMAAQLRAAGRAPLSITMIDTDPPQQPSREYSDIDALLELAGLFELHAERPLSLSAADFETLTPPAQLRLLHQRLMRADLLPSHSDPRDLAAVFKVFATNIRTSYTPRARCEQPVDLAWAPTGTEHAPSSAEPWRAWAPDLHLHPVEGNHVTLLQPPHVSSLARALQTVWSRAISP
jgi:thioesterase domain-containing protein